MDHLMMTVENFRLTALQAPRLCPLRRRPCSPAIPARPAAVSSPSLLSSGNVHWNQAERDIVTVRCLALCRSWFPFLFLISWPLTLSSKFLPLAWPPLQTIPLFLSLSLIQPSTCSETPCNLTSAPSLSWTCHWACLMVFFSALFLLHLAGSH